jgi:hypothetical protein
MVKRDIFEERWTKKRRSEIAMSDKRAAAALATEKLIEVQQRLWTHLLAIRRGQLSPIGELDPQERENRMYDLMERMIERCDEEPTYRCWLCRDRGQIHRVDDSGIAYSRRCSCVETRISDKKRKDADDAKVDFGPKPPEEEDERATGLFD